MTILPTMRRHLMRAALALFVLLCVGALGLYLVALPAIGAAPSGERLSRMQGSPAWRADKGRFDNALPRVDAPMAKMSSEWLFGGSDHRLPTAPIETEPRRATEFQTPPPSGLRVTWLGHSSLLLEIGAKRLLIDPVFGPRASPFSFAGPARFYAPPLPLESLPHLDGVLISHDHYDHLDHPTVLALSARRDLRWFVPLGVGAHLETWGVPRAQIEELDWWEDRALAELTVTCTPARHFSGRGLLDQNRTLWAGWSVASAQHRVFYSGDTAMHPELLQIGDRLGPFDLTIFEVGAYDAMWADVHLGPEQAVRAHRLVRGAVMLPVHWGLFDLALHGWTEPMERVLAAAETEGVRVLTPRPGHSVEPTRSSASPSKRWWPKQPFVPASVAPCPSTGVEALNGPAYAPGAWPPQP